MLAFGPGRASVLLLMAALTAVLATILFNTLRNEFDPVTAATGTLIFVSLPIVQKYSGMVMGEMLAGVLMLGAILFFGRFLDRERNADAIGFGVCAALAILTKGTGGALALAALLAMLLTRKFSVLKRPALWFSALIVVMLAGPWTWMFREQCRSGWDEPEISWHYTRQALVYFPWKFLVALGVLFAALALIGMIQMLVRHPRNPGKWAALAALAISVCLFQSIIPASQEARHLLPAIPAAILFAMAGLTGLTRWFGKSGLSLKMVQVMACGVVAALFFSTALAPARGNIGFSSLGDHPGLSPFQIARKGYSGFGALLDRLLTDPANKDAVFLISSDARGEGMFVSEVAMRDTGRPNHIILRAGKLLASSAWNGSGYKVQFATQDAVLEALAKSPAQIIVIDGSMPGPREHSRLLKSVVENHPEIFHPVDAFPILREGVPQSAMIRVYRVDRAFHAR